jgi:[NiFe] hydrogenase small subunit
MRISIGTGRDGGEERLAERGISRRDFLKFCTAVSVAMGMDSAFAPRVARALTSGRRPSVVYLHNAECTACTEALLRSYKPFLDELIFDVISLDYQETIMAAAGEAAEEALHEAVSNPEGFLCVVEGAIPTADNGIYGTIGGRTMLEISREVLPKARAVVAYGTCAAFGGIPAAAPNPTGCMGVNECFASLGVQAINIAGCPPPTLNVVAALVAVLTGRDIRLDHYNRPLMFYGETVHDRCERLPYFEAGEFAPAFDSEQARKGWCLYKLGCKGPLTMNNCPTVRFNDVNWPVAAGHPCIGCSEPGFWDRLSPFYEN